MFNCPVCNKDFDNNRRRPIIGFCGHTICFDCRGRLISYCCPISNACPLQCFILYQVNYDVKEIAELFERRQKEFKDAQKRVLQMISENEEVRKRNEETKNRLEKTNERLKEIERAERDERPEKMIKCPCCEEMEFEERLLFCEGCYSTGIRQAICASCLLEEHIDHNKSDGGDVSIITVSSDTGIEDNMTDFNSSAEAKAPDEVKDSYERFEHSFSEMSVLEESEESIICLDSSRGDFEDEIIWMDDVEMMDISSCSVVMV